MVEVKFETNGRVTVFSYAGGETVMVTTDVNKLREMLPLALFNDVREKSRELVRVMDAHSPRALKEVS